MEATKLGRTSRRTWLLSIGAAIGVAGVVRAVELYLRPASDVHSRTVGMGRLDAVVADGGRITVDIDGTNVLLSRTGTAVVALDLTCTHAACPLHVALNISRIQCACHGGAFDLEGNVVQAPPSRPLRRFVTRVEDGKLFVRMPARGSV